ncbi:hypothetical protein [Sphingomonas asaccharolytica]|uniref:hypothetical protein n=1 Tax=Sphingomonas asaccharolytica TaxID=40681 RepID=UPI00083266A4|nr:hypothetical protein [Sphingomonas asaccharolytica]
MANGKTLIIVLVTLVLGFAAGFALRPVIAPQPEPVAGALPGATVTSEARGMQYFVAHIDEARRIVAGCRDGSVRGGECATADQTISRVEAQERQKRFLGN